MYSLLLDKEMCAKNTLYFLKDDLGINAVIETDDQLITWFNYVVRNRASGDPLLTVVAQGENLRIDCNSDALEVIESDFT